MIPPEIFKSGKKMDLDPLFMGMGNIRMLLPHRPQTTRIRITLIQIQNTFLEGRKVKWNGNIENKKDLSIWRYIAKYDSKEKWPEIP
jgi:hypothetical protein